MRGLIFLFAGCFAVSAADVQFFFSDFTTATAPLTNRVLLVQPTNSTPRANGNSIITSDRLSYTNDGSASVTISNMVTATYHCVIRGPFKDTAFQITVPDTNILLNAKDLLSANTNSPPGSTAYSMTSADARFVLKTNAVFYGSTNIFRFTNGVSSGQFLSTDGTNWFPVTIAPGGGSPTNGLATTNYVNDATNALAGLISSGVFTNDNGVIHPVTLTNRFSLGSATIPGAGAYANPFVFITNNTTNIQALMRIEQTANGTFSSSVLRLRQSDGPAGLNNSYATSLSVENALSGPLGTGSIYDNDGAAAGRFEATGSPGLGEGVGVVGQSKGDYFRNFGTAGNARGAFTNVGVAGIGDSGIINIGGYFETPTSPFPNDAQFTESAALTIDNRDSGNTLLIARSNQVPMVKIWGNGITELSGATNNGTLDQNGVSRFYANLYAGGTVGSEKFKIDAASGNIEIINGVTEYLWPAAHAPGSLWNNGSGGLSWNSTNYLTSDATNTLYSQVTTDLNAESNAVRTLAINATNTLYSRTTTDLNGASNALQTAKISIQSGAGNANTFTNPTIVGTLTGGDYSTTGSVSAAAMNIGGSGDAVFIRTNVTTGKLYVENTTGLLVNVTNLPPSNMVAGVQVKYSEATGLRPVSVALTAGQYLTFDGSTYVASNLPPSSGSGFAALEVQTNNALVGLQTNINFFVETNLFRYATNNTSSNKIDLRLDTAQPITTQASPTWSNLTITGTASLAGLKQTGDANGNNFAFTNLAGLDVGGGVKPSPGNIQASNAIQIVRNAVTYNLGGSPLVVNTTLTTNSGSNETIIYTNTITGNTLAKNGESIEGYISFTCTNNANTKTIKLVFGSTALMAGVTHGYTSAKGSIDFKIIRISATTFRAQVRTLSSTSNFDFNQTTGTETLANNLGLGLTMQGSVTGDIWAEFYKLYWYP